MLGRLSKCHFIPFCLELLEFSEDRHPWESVEEKLHEIRYELLVVCFVHFYVQSSSRNASLRPYICPSLFASLPVPSSFSLPSQLLSPSLHPWLPTFQWGTVVSFFAPAICPSLTASFPLSLDSLDPFSLSPFLPPSFPPFLPSYPTRSPLLHSTNLPLTFHFLTVSLFAFLLPGQLSVFLVFFQRHDATNGKTDEGRKRMKMIMVTMRLFFIFL